MMNEHAPATIAIEIPDGFSDTEALRRIVRLVIALLMAGMSHEVILRRLTGEVL